MTTTAVLRPHAEQAFAGELAALDRADDRPRPPSWRLSPWAVVTYLLGGVLPDGAVISPKYVGPRRLVEVAVATLATDRALLLLGVPGTAKTWVSEHLAAAVSGDSTLLVQGTSGTAEEAIRYGWNYARLLAEGRPLADEALTGVPAPWPDPLARAVVERLGGALPPFQALALLATATRGLSPGWAPALTGAGARQGDPGLRRRYDEAAERLLFRSALLEEIR